MFSDIFDTPESECHSNFAVLGQHKHNTSSYLLNHRGRKLVEVPEPTSGTKDEKPLMINQHPSKLNLYC